jgi:hypothetical protein
MGGMLLGTFLPGFITSLQGDSVDTRGIVLYTALGMVGLVLTLYGVFKA